MSAESSDRLMRIAQTMKDDPNPAVRSLAMSVLRQFEPDSGPNSPTTLARAHSAKRSSDFWEGFWDGMWACQESHG
jgi:hypothetical protein